MNIKENKINIINKIKFEASNNSCLFVLNYKGVNVKTITDFRNNLFNKYGNKLIVAKNTFVKIALTDTSFNNLLQSLSGQNAFIFCKEPNEVSKLLEKFCLKDKKFKIIACSNDGAVSFSENYIKMLSSLPSLNEGRSILLATLNSAGSDFVRLISEPLVSFCRVLSSYCK